MSIEVEQESKLESGAENVENSDSTDNAMQAQVVNSAECGCCGGGNTRAYVTVFVLFFINLLNYMDRQTIAGKRKRVIEQ